RGGRHRPVRRDRKCQAQADSPCPLILKDSRTGRQPGRAAARESLEPPGVADIVRGAGPDRPTRPKSMPIRKVVVQAQRTTLCKGCSQQLHMPIPIRGPFSLPLRLVGVRPSRMNPNLCNLCETMFKRIMKRSQVKVSLTALFADVRGYTTYSENADAP